MRASVHTKHMPHIMIVNRLEANKERFRLLSSEQRLQSNSAVLHSIPAIRSKGSTSVLLTKKIRPIYSHSREMSRSVLHICCCFVTEAEARRQKYREMIDNRYNFKPAAMKYRILSARAVNISSRVSQNALSFAQRSTRRQLFETTVTSSD